MRANRLVAALSMAVLVACAKGDETATTDTTAATAAAATPPAPPMTDANIAGTLEVVNRADSVFGRIASTKGSDKEVRAFGVLMMKDHHDLQKAGEELFTRLGVTPAPLNDSLRMKVQKITDSLNVLPKGARFDKAYLDDEISNHQVVLGFIDDALGQNQNAEIKALLTKARPIVDMHLKRAQQIRAKIDSTATR
jgi:putative membrane protein